MIKRACIFGLLLTQFCAAQATHKVGRTGAGTFTTGRASSGSWVSGQPSQVVIVPVTPENQYCAPGGIPRNVLPDGPVTSFSVACYYTAIDGTPSGGAVRGPVTVANLQAEYALAACGDTILVTAGSSGSGPINLTKTCDDLHYLTIKSTGASNGNFPPEGERLTPCWAGIASQPGRPAYPCPSPSNLTFKVIAPRSDVAIQFTGSHHRIIGMEGTRVTTGGVPVYYVVDLNATGLPQANHLIIDRSYLHGVEGTGTFPQLTINDTSTTKGVNLRQSNHVAVINSWMGDFYTNGSGSGSGSANGNTDAQCISGGTGGLQLSGWGVYKMYNDYCEAGSEGFLTGGWTGPQPTPTGCTPFVDCTPDRPDNIELRANHFFKPLGWKSPTGALPGWPNVKNGMEIKTGAHGLLEGNMFENCWPGSQPHCYTWDLAPKNQMVNSAPGAPTAEVQDWVIRNNYATGYAYGFAMYSTMDAGCAGCWTRLDRVSVHDELIGDNFSFPGTCCGGDGGEIEANAGPVTNVTVNHVTNLAAARASFIFGSAKGSGQFDNISITNSIWAGGAKQYGLYISTASDAGVGCDGGGTGNPDYRMTNNATGMFNSCINGITPTWTLENNAFYGGLTPHTAPVSNQFLASAALVGFANYPALNALGWPDSSLHPENYALSTGSALHNAGTDGTDVGADLSKVVAATANVRGTASTTPITGPPPPTPGNLVLYPSASVTVPQTAVIPLSCQNDASITCTWSLVSGVGSVTASGVYTAPNTPGSAVVKAVNGSNELTAAITVSGTIPTATGDCAAVKPTGYTKAFPAANDCHMVHTEEVGTLTRRWKVVIPSGTGATGAYVPGQSGLYITLDSNHGLDAFHGDPCGPPSNEMAGYARYFATVPSPAPVLVCPEGPWDSIQTNDKWGYFGRGVVTWYGGITPNDPDFIRQVILTTVRDLQLDPKRVYIMAAINGQGYSASVADEISARNSDLVAGLWTNGENNFANLDANFVVGRTRAVNYGLTFPYPAGPISVVTTPGNYAQITSWFGQMCGNNHDSSSAYFHPLTTDDTFRYWNYRNQSTAHVYLPTTAGTSFCTGAYDGSNNGLPSALEVRKDSGGKLGTEIFAYRQLGNVSSGMPFCSHDYSGGDTLGCNDSTWTTTPVMDMRNTACSWQTPCNHYVDATTGYDQLNIMYRFLAAHPKP